jgi:4-hydroxybenzoyl-CoA thioesterase
MAPFVHRMPVRFADVDHAGIVYYPVFFHYFHVAFEEMFRERMGARAYVSLLDDDRIGFPAVASECSYKSPLRFGDTAEVRMSVDSLGTKSIRFRYRIFRIVDDGDQEPVLAAEGTNTCAVVDLEKFRAVPIPSHLRGLLDGLKADAEG